MQQNTHEQCTLGTKNWHIRFESIEHYGSTGSEMKPFLVGVAFVDFDLGELGVGESDGEGEGGDGEWMLKQIFSNDAQSCYSLPIPLILNWEIICTSGRGTNNNTMPLCTSGLCVVQWPTRLYPRHGVLF